MRFRSSKDFLPKRRQRQLDRQVRRAVVFVNHRIDRKSTRLNSSHSQISYAVFCLIKRKRTRRAVDEPAFETGCLKIAVMSSTLHSRPRNLVAVLIVNAVLRPFVGVAVVASSTSPV